MRRETQAKVDAGILKPGDKLPTTKELVDQYKTSRVTVRKAADLLIEAGVLEERHGAGVFVADTSDRNS
ncbi:GntR family transcriptional regulator [Micromonospora chersina]|uniref:GntR family transcriptional regulator n=1 Tax=Micromonospora chersina TaxID=47854 RepID=UPI0033C941A7